MFQMAEICPGRNLYLSLWYKFNYPLNLNAEIKRFFSCLVLTQISELIKHEEIKICSDILG